MAWRCLLSGWPVGGLALWLRTHESHVANPKLVWGKVLPQLGYKSSSKEANSETYP